MKELTRGNPLKLIIMFSIPLLIGNLFQQFYTLSDTVIVGRFLGVNALAAVGSTNSLTFLIIGFAQGATSGLAIRTAQLFGAKDYKGVKKSFAVSLWISLGISVVMTTLSVLFCHQILELMQTPPEIIDQAYSFLIVIFAGFSVSMGYNLLANILRALGDSRTPLIFLIVAVVVNVAIDFLLIAYLHIGTIGAGIATVTAQLVSMLLCVWYIKRSVPYLQLKKSDFKITKKDLTDHLRLALPMGFQSSIIAIGGVILQLMLNTLGPKSIAAYTAAGKIDQLATLPAMSFGIAMATFVAQNLGAHKFGRILKGVKQTLLLSIGISLTLGALIILFGKPLVNFFVGSGQPEVTNLAQQYFYVVSSMYWLLSILFIIRYTLQGLGKSMVPTIAGVFELVMRATAGLVFIRIFGFAGACLANPMAWTGSLLVLIPTYIKVVKVLKRREREELMGSDQELELSNN